MPFRFNPFTDKLDLTETGGGPPGSEKFIQQVQTSSSTYLSTGVAIPDDDTIPQSSEGDPLISLAITPTSATNILVFDFYCPAASDGQGGIILALFQDSNTDATFTASDDIFDFAMGGATFRYYMTAGTTSSTTFSIRYGAPASTGTQVYINGNASGRLFGGTSKVVFTISEINP